MVPEKRVLLSELTDVLKGKSGAYLCCASFEERSLSIAKAVRDLNFDKIVVFSAVDCSELINEKAEEIRNLFDEEVTIVSTKVRDPLFTANAIASILKDLNKEGISEYTIDITTFTHEMLIVLIGQLHRYAAGIKDIECLYLSAKEYSIGDVKEKKWLSKGCREVRSIVGFPGNLIPGRPTVLTVLVGFEHERASRMIVQVDPEYLFLGMGYLEDEHIMNPSHKEPMEYFHKLVTEMISSRGYVESFRFSCRDPHETAGTILNMSKKMSECNHIIVPMNTKISTVAVVLAALENPLIQLCYAEPETYNLKGYSIPGDKVTIFSIDTERLQRLDSKI